MLNFFIVHFVTKGCQGFKKGWEPLHLHTDNWIYDYRPFLSLYSISGRNWLKLDAN